MLCIYNSSPVFGSGKERFRGRRVTILGESVGEERRREHE